MTLLMHSSEHRLHGLALASEREKEALEVEAGLQKRKAKALALLEQELALHPFAGSHDEISLAATALVFSLDLAHPAMRLDSAEFEKRLTSVRRELGQGWLAARLGDRVWLMCPPSNAVIAIGPGFVATDGTNEDILRKLFVVIRALKFGELVRGGSA